MNSNSAVLELNKQHTIIQKALQSFPVDNIVDLSKKYFSLLAKVCLDLHLDFIFMEYIQLSFGELIALCNQAHKNIFIDGFFKTLLADDIKEQQYGYYFKILNIIMNQQYIMPEDFIRFLNDYQYDKQDMVLLNKVVIFGFKLLRYFNSNRISYNRLLKCLITMLCDWLNGKLMIMNKNLPTVCDSNSSDYGYLLNNSSSSCDKSLSGDTATDTESSVTSVEAGVSSNSDLMYGSSLDSKSYDASDEEEGIELKYQSIMDILIVLWVRLRMLCDEYQMPNDIYRMVYNNCSYFFKSMIHCSNDDDSFFDTHTQLLCNTFDIIQRSILSSDLQHDGFPARRSFMNEAACCDSDSNAHFHSVHG